MKEVYFVKSIRSEFDGLQTLKGDEKITTQTVDDIFSNLVINPNTLSFRWPPRLCTTILDDDYVKTYRPQGLIFTVEEGYKPDYIFPFDLNAITENNNPVVEYHAIKNELHMHYNVQLIEDFMKFASKSYGELVEKFKDKDNKIRPENILKIVNEFRQEQGWEPLSKDKQKLVEYNEAIFLRPVKINIVAIYGDVKNEFYQSIAKQYGVPIYNSAEEFYNDRNK